MGGGVGGHGIVKNVADNYGTSHYARCFENCWGELRCEVVCGVPHTALLIYLMNYRRELPLSLA